VKNIAVIKKVATEGIDLFVIYIYIVRLTTKAYKLSYNYISFTVNLVGRPFGKWRRRRLCSGVSRRVRRVRRRSFGCAVRRAL
jgi:hypothetical protein